MKATFQNIIDGDRPVLVDFFATWCGPCMAMQPILQEVASRLGERAKIVKIDIDKNPDLAAKMNIRSVPTLHIYRQGRLLWQQSGMQSARSLENLLEQYADY